MDIVYVSCYVVQGGLKVTVVLFPWPPNVKIRGMRHHVLLACPIL